LCLKHVGLVVSVKNVYVEFKGEARPKGDLVFDLVVADRKENSHVTWWRTEKSGNKKKAAEIFPFRY
jgi:hypothetical protein